jgi:hypothetical protein
LYEGVKYFYNRPDLDQRKVKEEDRYLTLFSKGFVMEKVENHCYTYSPDFP